MQISHYMKVDHPVFQSLKDIRTVLEGKNF